MSVSNWIANDVPNAASGLPASATAAVRETTASALAPDPNILPANSGTRNAAKNPGDARLWKNGVSARSGRFATVPRLPLTHCG